jgi:kinesin family protein C1
MRKVKVDKSNVITNGYATVNGTMSKSLVAPKTPSQIPVLKKAEALPNATPAATPSRSSKFSSPTKQVQYLTKDSNIPAFTAWDVHGRLEDMEAMYTELKKTLAGTAVDRNGLEEAIAQYKARCMISQ